MLHKAGGLTFTLLKLVGVAPRLPGCQALTLAQSLAWCLNYMGQIH